MKINVSDDLRLSSADWVKLTGVIIFDPDGWNRQDFQVSWAEMITIAEFKRRAGHSNVIIRTYDAAFC